VSAERLGLEAGFAITAVLEPAPPAVVGDRQAAA
jgi:hypothetical protein